MSTANGAAPERRQTLGSWLANPWAETRFLWVVGIVYVMWSLLPVVGAVLFSFNKGRSITQWEGFSLKWYTGDPTQSVLHDPSLQHAVVQSLKLASLTAIVSVPLGVGFALSLHRWQSRTAKTENFLMLFSFVTPELILAVSLFLLFTSPLKTIGLGTPAEVVGLTVLAVAYPVVIVRARLLSLGRSYEEAGMDLGASPARTMWRVTLPLLGPSIFASGAIVFALALDDFVIVNVLSKDASTQTVAMVIYGAARTAPTPAINAIGSLMLATSTLIIVIAFLVWRRSERKRSTDAIPTAARVPV
jgi:spermidine/putrescine transport system permease protein